MLVDLQVGGPVNDCRNLVWCTPAEIPSAEGDAVAKIVEQAAAAEGLLVPPRAFLLLRDFLWAHFYLVGDVIERTAIAVVVMNLDDTPDGALVRQSLSGEVARIPGKRPVDGDANRPFPGGGGSPGPA